MNARFAVAFLALALLSPSDRTAQAQPVPPGEEGKLASLVAPQPGAHKCFQRTYDAAHLSARPDQTVTAMEFRLAYHRFEPDEFYPQGQRNYYFALLVKRRGESRRLTAEGECIAYGDGISCGIDCDGGGLGIVAHEDGSLLVDLTPFGRIRMTRSCGDGEDSVDLEPGKDDKTFRLDPVPASQCPAYEDW